MLFQVTSGIILVFLTPSLGVHVQEPPAPTRVSRNTPVEGYVDVRLNHFMAYDTGTFPMRYYYNNEFGSTDIVIVIGGEWEISPGFVTGGLAYELAERLGAGLFYTEHRFYGKTRPFADTSVSGLRFLTVDQALADLAQFIQYIKSGRFQSGWYSNGRVALVGCSYAGSMATWMRLAYPHLVDAAFSDSGPLYAQEDFPEYLEVIAEAIRSQGSEECLASIQEGMERVVQLLGTPSGITTVSTMFKTCSEIDAANSLDVATFFWYGITETFAYLVQYATPGQIPRACEVLTDSSVADAATRLGNWVTAQSNTQPCIESRYSEVVAAHTNTSFDSSDAVMRLWTYQTCVEFGWYQTTNSSRQPFLSTVPLEYFHQMCKDFFSSYFDEDLLRSGISRTNLFFGGRYLPDNVVSVVGGHDPWSPMGPRQSDEHPKAPVHVVPGISHCRAMGATGATDIEELEKTKELVLSQMANFILNPEPPLSAAEHLNTPVLMLTSVIFYFLFFDEDLLRSGISRTNLFFGGRYLPDNVVSVVGGHDPWSPMGPRQSDEHPKAPVHVVPGISHCRAMGATGATDIEELEKTKWLVLSQMADFIWNPGQPPSAAEHLNTPVLMLTSVIFYFLL